MRVTTDSERVASAVQVQRAIRLPRADLVTSSRLFFGGSPFGTGGRAQSGPPRGQDLEVVTDITLEQAVFGGTIPVDVRTAVRCDECNGTGAGGGTQPVSCSDCGGSGQVRRVRQSLLGQMVTSGPCTRCSWAQNFWWW